MAIYTSTPEDETFIGTPSNDRFFMGHPSGSYGHDVIHGGGGSNALVFYDYTMFERSGDAYEGITDYSLYSDYTRSAIVADLGAGTVRGGGIDDSSATFTNINTMYATS